MFMPSSSVTMARNETRSAWYHYRSRTRSFEASESSDRSTNESTTPRLLVRIATNLCVGTQRRRATELSAVKAKAFQGTRRELFLLRYPRWPLRILFHPCQEYAA